MAKATLAVENDNRGSSEPCDEHLSEEQRLFERHSESFPSTAEAKLAEQSRTPPNLSSLVKLTIGFFCVFFSFTIQQNLMPVVLEEASSSGHIAFASLAVLYVVFMPACLVVPMVMRSVNPRKVLPVGTSCYALFALAAVGPATLTAQASTWLKVCANVVLLIAAILIGASGAMVWLCQGYIMTHISPQRLLNRYVSFFFAFFNLASILGAVAADQALSMMGSALFFVFLFSVSIFGTVVLCCIGAPSPHEDIIPEPSLQPYASCKDVASLIRAPFTILGQDGRVARLVWLSLGTGFSMNAFTSAGLPQFVLARSGSSRTVAQALVGVGCGRFAASVGYGYIADRFGRRFALALTLPSLCCTVALLTLEGNSKLAYPIVGSLSIRFAYIGSFFQGFTNGSCFCSLNALISSGFHGDEGKSVFALQYLSNSFMSVLGFAVIPTMSRESSLACVALLLLSCILLTVAHEPLFNSSDTKAQTTSLPPALVGASAPKR